MPTKARLTVAAAVKHYRTAKGYSTFKAAEFAGIRPMTWNRIELAKVDPRLSTLEAMAYTLDIPVSALFGLLWADKNY